MKKEKKAMTRLLLWSICFMVCFLAQTQAQMPELRKNPELNQLSKQVVNSLYAWDFQKADSLIAQLSAKSMFKNFQ